jgi:hypothetical protein
MQIITVNMQLHTLQLRVAIVGAGPAGMYTAKYLLREMGIGGVDINNNNTGGDDAATKVDGGGGGGVRVDVFDALPTPHGLVRTVRLAANNFDFVTCVLCSLHVFLVRLAAND